MISKLLTLWLFAFAFTVGAAKAEVRSATGEFVDTARQRTVPWRIYYDQSLPGPRPVLIASHGLGGSRDNLGYLARHLAGNGFVTVHIQHAGSDKGIRQGHPFRSREARRLTALSLRTIDNAVNRYLDIPFVVQALSGLNKGNGLFAGRLNMQQLGMFGHSYGAKSVLIAAGQMMGVLGNYNFPEPAIKAAVALSPGAPRTQLTMDQVFADVKIPLFHITGTQDRSPVQQIDPVSRQLPFRHIPAGHQYLLVLDKADHMTFSGHRVGTPQQKPDDTRHVSLIQNSVLAFFQTHLLDDAKAGQWLKTEFPKQLDRSDTFETR